MPDLPKKIEDWTPPWGTDDSEFDAEKAKRLLFNALTGQQNAKAAAKTAKDERDALTTERDELKTKVEELEDKDLTEVQRLQRENERLRNAKPAAKDKPNEGDSEADLRAARLEIALDKGLTKTQAARLVGTTREELEADADAYIEEHGLAAGGSEGEEGNDDGKGGDGKSGPPTQRPQPTLRTSRSKDDDVNGEYVDPATVELVPRR